MPSIDDFMSLLKCQHDLLSRLVNLANEEHECLVRNTPDRLDTIVKDQSRLLAAQTKLTGHVTATMRQLLGDHADARPLTLSSMAEVLDEPHASTVRQYSRELTEISETLQRKGRVNFVLSQHMMRYVDFTLRLLSNDADTPQAYQVAPQGHPAKSIRLLMDTSA